MAASAPQVSHSAARECDGTPDPGFRADVLAGLTAPARAIPARWFYDRRGSELFEEITRQPEYGPTRAETAILAAAAGAIGALTGPGRAVVEFGSGSSTKTPLLLRALDPGAYVPIDISGGFLREAAAALAGQFPALQILPVEADFTRPVMLPAAVGGIPRLGFFPGSTIGNLEPAAAVDLLRTMRASLDAVSGAPAAKASAAMLLIGFDRIKDRNLLVRAYDDAAGVTAAFNLNLLARINRELGGTIDVGAFAHRAIWNDAAARIEMHLEALRDVDFMVDGRAFSMTGGETIHTENSHKYGRRDAELLLRAGGWTPVETWTDADDQFAVILTEALAVGPTP